MPDNPRRGELDPAEGVRRRCKKNSHSVNKKKYFASLAFKFTNHQKQFISKVIKKERFKVVSLLFIVIRPGNLVNVINCRS